VQVEHARRDTVELLEPVLGEAPEALDPVDVTAATGELVGRVVDPEVLRVPDIDQAVVAAPAVAVDDRVECDSAADYA
jgi:hypothetical protein